MWSTVRSPPPAPTKNQPQRPTLRRLLFLAVKPIVQSYTILYTIFIVASSAGLLTRFLLYFGSCGRLEVNQVLRSEIDRHFAPGKQDWEPAAGIDLVQGFVKLVP